MSFLNSIFNRKEQIDGHQFQKDPTALMDEEKEQAEEINSYNEGEEEKSSEQEGIDDDTEYEVVEREILPNKIICPDCGGITLEGLEFCDKCGGELL